MVSRVGMCCQAYNGLVLPAFGPVAVDLAAAPLHKDHVWYCTCRRVWLGGGADSVVTVECWCFLMDSYICIFFLLAFSYLD